MNYFNQNVETNNDASCVILITSQQHCTNSSNACRVSAFYSAFQFIQENDLLLCEENRFPGKFIQLTKPQDKNKYFLLFVKQEPESLKIASSLICQGESTNSTAAQELEKPMSIAGVSWHLKKNLIA